MVKLKIIVTSTRPGRLGIHLARWVEELARRRPGFEVDLVDLAEVNLPFMDEPNHPMQRQYTKDHTKAWSRRIDEADAFVFVAAEYNYGYTAPFKNAVDYLYHEWKDKPVAFVSYGGIAGGTRAVQLMKPVLSMFNTVCLSEGVQVPFVRKFIDESGFHANEEQVKNAELMLDALNRWGSTLQTLRRQ